MADFGGAEGHQESQASRQSIEIVANACEQSCLNDDHCDGFLAAVEDVEVDGSRDGDESLDRVGHAVDVQIHVASVAQRSLPSYDCHGSRVKRE
jgi:hypothetical protein